MRSRRGFLQTAGVGFGGTLIGFPGRANAAEAGAARLVYDVRAFGAAGDGKAIDSPAIDRAIAAAASAGGGTVFVPAGNYLCFSIHLKSKVEIYLDQGATIVAAEPARIRRAAMTWPNRSKLGRTIRTTGTITGTTA